VRFAARYIAGPYVLRISAVIRRNGASGQDGFTPSDVARHGENWMACENVAMKKPAKKNISANVMEQEKGGWRKSEAKASKKRNAVVTSV